MKKYNLVYVVLLSLMTVPAFSIEELSEIEFLSDKNESLKNDIIFSLTKGNDTGTISTEINLKYDKKLI